MLGQRLALYASLADPLGVVGGVRELRLEVILAAVDDLVVLRVPGALGVGGAERRPVVLRADIADLVARGIVPREGGVLGVGDGLVELVAEGAHCTIRC